MDAVKRTGKPFIAAVSGVKNSGKTTFMEKLISELAGQGYRVAVIKHDGHEFQADREGTDTYRMRQAGAYGTCIFSSGQWQVVKQQQDVRAEELAEFFPEADIILLEGMKDSDYPKFELVRGEISHKSVCRSDALLGLVTDTELKIPGVPVFGFHETEKCTEILIKIVQTNKD